VISVDAEDDECVAISPSLAAMQIFGKMNTTNKTYFIENSRYSFLLNSINKLIANKNNSDKKITIEFSDSKNTINFAYYIMTNYSCDEVSLIKIKNSKKIIIYAKSIE